MNTSKKITVLLTMFIAINVAYLVYGIVVSRSFVEMTINISFVLLSLVIGFVHYNTVRNHIQNVFLQLSEVVGAIIDMRETEVFSTLDDNMLSKLQSQVIKLSGILKAQNNRLEREKNEIKSLISDIAHQLKNPLCNLNLYVSFLKDETLDEKSKQEFVCNIVGQLEKLNWLMESMIKMTRLEGGIIQLKPEKSSLNDLLLTALKQIYLRAEKKQINLSFNPGEDIVLKTDKKWTSEAFTNILENAVKYTADNGKISIRILQYEMYVRVDIEDSGSGIEGKEINNIFKRFYRGSNSKNQDGVGIGLYLSREIISRQDGYIKVKSTPGVGSTFSVFLLMMK